MYGPTIIAVWFAHLCTPSSEKVRVTKVVADH